MQKLDSAAKAEMDTSFALIHGDYKNFQSIEVKL